MPTAAHREVQTVFATRRSQRENKDVRARKAQSFLFLTLLPFFVLNNIPVKKPVRQSLALAHKQMAAPYSPWLKLLILLEKANSGSPRSANCVCYTKCTKEKDKKKQQVLACDFALLRALRVLRG
ncbi:hypothetical protein [Shewanella sp. NFH-SH190041]|uniref:hypothetical protein n=1 Tax=Shewanella sp. NFH-SH190041 TaxID=2950245 RepID=UPI0021C452EE|nr:hypothetical protein [Shewanella sp. NFH-SH190041]